MGLKTFWNDSIRPSGTKGMQLLSAQRSKNPAVLRSLATSKHRDVQAAVRANPHTPIDVLTQLYLATRGEKSSTRNEILAHPAIVQLVQTARESQSATELVELTKSQIYEVQLSVAENQHAPAEALTLLSDKDLPHWIPRERASWTNNRIHEAVARHRNTPTHILDGYARGLKSNVARLAAENLNHCQVPIF